MLSNLFFNYLTGLCVNEKLPNGISILDPLNEDEKVKETARLFYQKFYNDNISRILILGINPGRLGGGATGIPFTDTIRLKEKCEIEIHHFKSYEPSSVFIYDWIDAMGGVETFYNKFLINSVCPLGFVKQNINYNYYDDKKLENAVLPLIKYHLSSLIKMGFRRDVVFCLGAGKNYTFLSKLNEKERYFDEVIPLEHPRFIMQYKSKLKNQYISDFIKKVSCQG